MTAKTFDATLICLLDRTPFQAFTVELRDGKRFEIDRPKSTVLRDGKAIFIGSPFKVFEFDHKMVKAFIEGPAGAAKALG